MRMASTWTGAATCDEVPACARAEVLLRCGCRRSWFWPVRLLQRARQVTAIRNDDTRPRSTYVEARGGAGYLWTRWGVGSAAGPSYSFGLSLGGAVGRRAAFLADRSYARLQPLTAGVYPDLRSGAFYAAGPRMKYYLTQSGLFVSSHPHDYLVDLELVGVGPGATFYVPGINAFASFSASVSQVSYRNGSPLDTRYGTDVASGWGLTGRLVFGKEWWISSNWGLGLASEVLLGRMGRRDEPGYDGPTFHFTAKGCALLASASFNWQDLPAGGSKGRLDRRAEV